MSMTEDERREHAKRALGVFKGLITTVYQPLLRAVLRKPKMTVLPHPSASFTDGKAVYLMVPWVLGETREHDRTLCNKRDPASLRMLCQACETRDSIDADVFHESAHITSNSFEEVDPDLVMPLVREHLPWVDADSLKLPTHYKGQRATFGITLKTIEPTYLPWVFNLVEDIYVNRRLFEARPGVEKPMQRLCTSVMTKGYTNGSGVPIDWSKTPVDAQAAMVAYLLGARLPHLVDNLVPEVHPLRDDQELVEAMASLPGFCKIYGRLEVTFRVLTRLRELGYCIPPSQQPEPQGNDGGEEEEQQPNEEDEEAPPQPPGQPGSGGTQGQEQSDDDEDAETEGEAEESDDEQSGDEESGDEESGDESEDEESEDEAQGDGSGSSEEDEAEDDEESEGSGAGDDDEESDDEESTDEDDDEADAEVEDDEEFEDEESEEFEDEESEEDGDDEPSDEDSDDGDQDLPSGTSEEEPEPGPTPEELDKAASDEFGKLMRELMNHDEGESQDPDDDIKPVTDDQGDDDKNDIDRAIRWEKFDAPPGGIADFYEEVPDASDVSHYKYDMPVLDPGLVSGETARLRVVFALNRKRKLTGSLKSGPKLDVPNLHRIGQEDFRIFGRQDRPNKRDWFVLVGLDDSGSTHSNGAARVIREMALSVGEMFTGTGIKFAMYGHGGTKSPKSFSFNFDPEDGTWRVRHLVVKGPDEPWSNEVKERISALGRDETCNYDGHTLEQYRKVIAPRRETDKMILYFTDGEMPCMNYDEELTVLKRELDILRRMRVKLVGVGYQTDSPKQHGMDTLVIQNGSDLPGLIDGLRERLSV